MRFESRVCVPRRLARVAVSTYAPIHGAREKRNEEKKKYWFTGFQVWKWYRGIAARIRFWAIYNIWNQLIQWTRGVCGIRCLPSSAFISAITLFLGHLVVACMYVHIIYIYIYFVIELVSSKFAFQTVSFHFFPFTRSFAHPLVSFSLPLVSACSSIHDRLRHCTINALYLLQMNCLLMDY